MVIIGILTCGFFTLVFTTRFAIDDELAEIELKNAELKALANKCAVDPLHSAKCEGGLCGGMGDGGTGGMNDEWRGTDGRVFEMGG